MKYMCPKLKLLLYQFDKYIQCDEYLSRYLPHLKNTYKKSNKQNNTQYIGMELIETICK